MIMLTADQANFYQQNGYLAPINIFTDEEANALYKDFQWFENEYYSRSMRVVCLA